MFEISVWNFHLLGIGPILCMHKKHWNTCPLRKLDSSFPASPEHLCHLLVAHCACEDMINHLLIDSMIRPVTFVINSQFNKEYITLKVLKLAWSKLKLEQHFIFSKDLELGVVRELGVGYMVTPSIDTNHVDSGPAIAWQVWHKLEVVKGGKNSGKGWGGL